MARYLSATYVVLWHPDATCRFTLRLSCTSTLFIRMNRYGGADMGVCRKRGAFACRCTMRRATATDAACRRRQSSGSSRRERPTTGVQGGALQRGSGGKTAVSQARERHDFERPQGLRHPLTCSFNVARAKRTLCLAHMCVEKRAGTLPSPQRFFGPGGGRRNGCKLKPTNVSSLAVS